MSKWVFQVDLNSISVGKSKCWLLLCFFLTRLLFVVVLVWEGLISKPWTVLTWALCYLLTFCPSGKDCSLLNNLAWSWGVAFYLEGIHEIDVMSLSSAPPGRREKCCVFSLCFWFGVQRHSDYKRDIMHLYALEWDWAVELQIISVIDAFSFSFKWFEKHQNRRPRFHLRAQSALPDLCVTLYGCIHRGIQSN